MMKHQQEKDFKAETDFKGKVKSQFQDCLSSQVAEGVYLRRYETEVLNTKAEWHQPALWRVRSELNRE